jgi:hypothetical protein
MQMVTCGSKSPTSDMALSYLAQRTVTHPRIVAAISGVNFRRYSIEQQDVTVQVDNDGFGTVTLNRANQFNTFSDKVRPAAES